jgi:hypothetical protein
MKNKNIVKYIAKVVKNNSLQNTEGIPSQNGSVQIYVEPVMNGWEEEHYPWAFPDTSGTGGSSDFGVSNIPEEDSYVWVWYEREDFKNWFYGGSVNNNEINPHKLFQTNVQAELLSQSIYPNAKFFYFKNGICMGVDSSDDNPEFFVFHPEGASMFFNKDGKVYLDGVKVFLGTNKAGSTALESDPLAGVTTGNSHFGVLDAITGIKILPSTSVFAKITP